MESKNVHEALLRGQAEVNQLLYGFADSFALKSAVELRLADIIHNHGGPITLSQIASRISSSCPNYIDNVARIMRMLVRKGVFEAHSSSEGETLYGMTHISKWLLHDSELTIAPLIKLEMDPRHQLPWHYISQCVKEGGIPFEKAHGCEIWDFASQNHEFNNMFNEAMACLTNITMKAFVSTYKDGFDNILSLVDVGGGTCRAVAEIVKSFPHIKGINFDLPHVIATAPVYDGVSLVGGDMFNSIPKADAVFMKMILHDWDDKDCVRILKNCRKAIPEKNGKIILVDIVVKEDGNNKFGDTDLAYDLCMFAVTSGGKERTEQEWKKILEDGGFPRYKIINMPAIFSIIEAYPL